MLGSAPEQGVWRKMLSEDGELVQVWIPRVDLEAVYGLVADRKRAREGARGSDAGNGLEPGDPWTPELLRRAYEESEEAPRRVLKYLAERPEQAVPSSELIDLVGEIYSKDVDFTHLSGVIGAFGRRVASRYGLRNNRGGAILPFRHPWDPKVGTRVYIMPERIAQVISEL